MSGPIPTSLGRTTAGAIEIACGITTQTRLASGQHRQM